MKISQSSLLQYSHTAIQTPKFELCKEAQSLFYIISIAVMILLSYAIIYMYEIN